jgi:hypothetical protein
VSNKFVVYLLPIITTMMSSGCSEDRRDPCQLLTAEEVKSVDVSVDYSLWAGRGGEKKENEVCMYYAPDGDPRVMLFVWYDKEKDPRVLVNHKETDKDSMVVNLTGIGSQAAAVFSGSELRLLAVRSAEGVVGLRVRKPVTQDSLEFLEITQLTETALSRN